MAVSLGENGTMKRLESHPTSGSSFEAARVKRTLWCSPIPGNALGHNKFGRLFDAYPAPQNNSPCGDGLRGATNFVQSSGGCRFWP